MNASTYTVEIGWNAGRYSTRLTTANVGQAAIVYAGYNVHSGGKKRLKRDGQTIARVLTDRYGLERVLEPRCSRCGDVGCDFCRSF